MLVDVELVGQVGGVLYKHSEINTYRTPVNRVLCFMGLMTGKGVEIWMNWSTSSVMRTGRPVQIEFDEWLSVTDKSPIIALVSQDLAVATN